MGDFNFTKNSFGLNGLNKNTNCNNNFGQKSNYDILGRKTVEQVQDEMKQLHGLEKHNEYEENINVNDLQQDLRSKMDNLRNIGKMQ